MKENILNTLDVAFWIFVRIIVLMCFALEITLHNSGDQTRAINGPLVSFIMIVSFRVQNSVPLLKRSNFVPITLSIQSRSAQIVNFMMFLTVYILFLQKFDSLGVFGLGSEYKDECEGGNCMSQLSFQVLILMLAKPFPKFFKDIILP